jgi:hypothetical protein
MAMRGFSTLTKAEDLLRKLEREYARLQADPTDVDCAWNFFVTAEHLPDWLSEGKDRLPTGEKLGDFKRDNQLIRICSHLANGGKHFAPWPSYKSVSAIEHDGVVDPDVYEPDIFEEWMSVHLTPHEAAAFGQTTIDVRQLAAQVLAFWQQQLRGTAAP